MNHHIYSLELGEFQAMLNGVPLQGTFPTRRKALAALAKELQRRKHRKNNLQCR